MTQAQAKPGKTLLSPNDHTLIMIDHQSQMAFATKSIDGVVLRNMVKINGMGRLFETVKQSSGIDPAYTADFRSSTTEALIRALELRMDRVPAVRAKDTVDMYYRAGLLLTQALDRSRMPGQLGTASERTHALIVLSVLVTAVGYQLVITHPFGQTRPTWLRSSARTPAAQIGRNRQSGRAASLCGHGRSS